MMILILLCAQDLFRPGSPEEARTRAVLDPSRLDLRLPAVPSFSDPPLEADFTAPIDGAFAWQGFDLRDNFRDLISRNIREDLLESILDSLVGRLSDSSMTLLCQISPSTADMLKHYRTTTHTEQMMELDLTRSLEGSVEDPPGSIAAAALKACLQQRRRKGETLTEALRHCQLLSEMRTIDGQSTPNYTLVSDLADALKLDEATRALLDRVVGNRTLDKGTMHEHPSAGLHAEFRTLQEEFAAAWNAAATDPATVHRRVPEQTPPLTDAEVQRLMETPPAQRRVLLESIASASALVELTRRVHRVERILETAQRSPNLDAESRKRLESERASLRSDLARLGEEQRQLQFLQDTLRSALEISERDRDNRLRRVLEAQAREQGAARARDTTRPWSSR